LTQRHKLIVVLRDVHCPGSSTTSQDNKTAAVYADLVSKEVLRNSATVFTSTVPVPSLDQGRGRH